MPKKRVQIGGNDAKWVGTAAATDRYLDTDHAAYMGFFSLPSPKKPVDRIARRIVLCTRMNQKGDMFRRGSCRKESSSLRLGHL